MFLSKNSKFFDSLVDQALLVKKTSKVFQKITHDYKYLKEGIKELKRLEDKGDGFVHAITDELEKVFLLPLDKEDIKEITETLDDIIDNLEEVGNRLFIYKIKKTNNDLKGFATLIFKSAELIHASIVMIKNSKLSNKEFVKSYIKLHELENQGDTLHRETLAKLMNSKSILEIIKLKEIYQTLEDTLDKCEDLSITFDRLRIKYG